MVINLELIASVRCGLFFAKVGQLVTMSSAFFRLGRAIGEGSAQAQLFTSEHRKPVRLNVITNMLRYIRAE